MSAEKQTIGLNDTVGNRVKAWLARTGSNMDDAIRYKREVSNRKDLSRRSERIPGWTVERHQRLSTSEYLGQVARYAVSQEDLDARLNHDARRSMVIAGRRAAAVGLGAALAAGLIQDAVESRNASSQSEVIQTVDGAGLPAASTTQDAPLPEDLLLPGANSLTVSLGE